MSKFVAAVVGLGNLGRYSLVSLLASAHVDEIWGVDLSAQALDASRDLATDDRLNPRLHLTNQLSELPRELDFVLISTTADARAVVLRELTNVTSVRWLLIEKPVSNSSRGIDDVQEFVSNFEKVWINFPRRYSRTYQNLRADLISTDRIHAAVYLPGGGLLTNAFHFLDLMAWFVESTEVSFDFRGVSENWVSSKRDGYFDKTGELRAKFGQTHELKVICEQTISESHTKIFFSGLGGNINVREVESNEPPTRSGEKRAFVPPQSALVGQLVAQLKAGDGLLMPEFSQVRDWNYSFLSAFENSSSYSDEFRFT